jgi:hypothetical protein
MFKVEEFFYFEDGANRFLRNTGNFLPDHISEDSYVRIYHRENLELHKSWNAYLRNFVCSSTMN